MVRRQSRATYLSLPTVQPSERQSLNSSDVLASLPLPVYIWTDFQIFQPIPVWWVFGGLPKLIVQFLVEENLQENKKQAH